jgi:hypothetical protein
MGRAPVFGESFLLEWRRSFSTAGSSSERRSREVRMRMLAVMTLASFVMLACEAGTESSGALSPEQCREIATKISKLVPTGNADGLGHELQLATDDAEAIARCVRGESWSRSGFECAMQATSKTGLERCLLAND